MREVRSPLFKAFFLIFWLGGFAAIGAGMAGSLYDTLALVVSCWFDSGSPECASLDVSASAILGPAIGLVVFGLALVWVLRDVFGKSREARATKFVVPTKPSLLERSPGVSPRAEGGAALLESYGPLGHLPLPEVRHRAGRELPIALSADTESRRERIVLVIFAVFWNGMSWAILISVLSSAGNLGETPVPAAVASLFAVIGLYLAWKASKPYTTHWRKVPTVELDREPLALGNKLRVLLRQPGGVLVNHYALSLVCEEWIRYRVGTDTRTDAQTLFDELLFADEHFEVEKGKTFSKLCEVDVPEQLPHSFAAEDNQIAWKLVVKADIAKFPDLDESFTLRVLPPIS